MTTHKQNVTTSFRIVTEMVRSRGIPSSRWEQLNGEDVLAIGGGRYVFHIDDKHIGFRVIYDLNSKFRVSSIKKLLEGDEDDEGGEMKLKNFIVIVSNPTPAATKSIRELNNPDIELFDIKWLQYNVSRHELQPQEFQPVRNEEEIEAIVKRYSLKTRTQLPLIPNTDPMARYYALRPGQLVRVTRRSPSAGTTGVYRCCTHS